MNGMNDRNWSDLLAILSGVFFFIGCAIALLNYQTGYNFVMLSVPIILVAIWYELRAKRVKF